MIYYDAEMKTRVDAFAKSLGIDSMPRLLAGESAVDMTVTLGADFKAEQWCASSADLMANIFTRHDSERSH